MKAEELKKRYKMSLHAENGYFIETHYESEKKERAASGSIYYYINPGEITQAHKIDCDEYWSFNAGSSVEICLIDTDGNINIKQLGIEKGCEPTIYMKKGTIFLSKNKSKTEGSFITCITVPRFSYEGFTLLSKEQLISQYPLAEEFYR